MSAQGAEGQWTTFGAYGTSKLAGTALTYELAHRLPAGVTACVMTPGIVNTELGRFAPLLVRALTWPLRLWLMRTPAQGADTAIWLATAAECAETQNGKYYYERSVIESSDASRDREKAVKLWETIEKQAPLVSLGSQNSSTTTTATTTPTSL